MAGANASLNEKVLQLVAKKTGLQLAKLTMDSRLLHDLGVDGDDAAELLTSFADEFRVDMTTFRFSKHFRPEPSLLDLISFLRSPHQDDLSTKIPITLRDLADAATIRTWGL